MVRGGTAVGSLLASSSLPMSEAFHASSTLLTGSIKGFSSRPA
jgi:hypothetical protein